MMALEAVNIGFGTVGAQDYKWAHAVIDEETGEVMNLKKTTKISEMTGDMDKSSIE